MKDIPGYEGKYAIDDQGNIWSLNFKMSGKPGKLTPTLRKRDGYLEVNLTKEKYQSRTWAVHQLMMLTFVGEPEEGQVICHNNGIRTDNRLENLRYDTQANNNLDKRQHNREGQKLTKQDVVDIRWLYTVNIKAKEIAEMFGVSRVQVYNIVKRKHWQHVETQTTVGNPS